MSATNRRRGLVDQGRPACGQGDEWGNISHHEAEGDAPLLTYGIIDPDYARVFTMARCLAWSEGYALLFHGSFTRDLDLVAVPWTPTACEPDHLLRRVVAAANLNIVAEDDGKKPHGRKSWTLVFKTFGDPRFIDFSIMPRQRDFLMTDDAIRELSGAVNPPRPHERKATP